eukprot:TRINITY_DN56837_c0_g1_i1.p1 TRINITY_DN56837_c0_g1~~TRINITY_DN56837_c0_g1_i1.p1  ORF type:complete len:223 (+),score=35.56 TRINITY_DN56837_c0_g1_i1:246-914(+)
MASKADAAADAAAMSGNGGGCGGGGGGNGGRNFLGASTGYAASGGGGNAIRASNTTTGFGSSAARTTSLSASYPERLGSTFCLQRAASQATDSRIRRMWTTPHNRACFGDVFVNESHANQLLDQSNAREKLVRRRSELEFRRRSAFAEEERQQKLAEIAEHRARLKGCNEGALSAEELKPPTFPNERFSSFQRKGKSMIRREDNRSVLLTKTFLHGKWTYTT